MSDTKIISDSKVYIDTVRLSSLLLKISEKMSKLHRHLLGEPLIDQIVGMLDDITNASIVRNPEERLKRLDSFMAKLSVLSALITILAESKQVSIKYEAMFSELRENIGKQVNSWRSRLKK